MNSICSFYNLKRRALLFSPLKKGGNIWTSYSVTCPRRELFTLLTWAASLCRGRAVSSLCAIETPSPFSRCQQHQPLKYLQTMSSAPHGQTQLQSTALSDARDYSRGVRILPMVSTRHLPRNCTKPPLSASIECWQSVQCCLSVGTIGRPGR